MSKAAILAKIRKCLALASSSNEHEAAAALAKARALMEEHNFTDADVALADVDQVGATRATKAARPPQWETLLVVVIADTFQCESYLNGANVMFVGVSARPAVASYAFAMVRRIIAKNRRDYIARRLRRCKAATKRSRADHFCFGFVAGIMRAIESLVPASSGCELARAWMEQNLKLQTVQSRTPLATRSRSTGSDYCSGFARGREVDLHHGLGAETGLVPARISAS